MLGLQAKDVRRQACGRGGPLSLPCNGCHVVMKSVDGVLAEVPALPKHSVVHDHCRQFQVTIGDCATWVSMSHQAALNIVWE